MPFLIDVITDYCFVWALDVFGLNIIVNTIYIGKGKLFDLYKILHKIWHNIHSHELTFSTKYVNVSDYFM